MRQLFFIEGQLLGEAARGLHIIHGQAQEPTSDLCFCQFCGVVYANLPVVLPSGRNTPYQSHRGVCRGCCSRVADLYYTPGSIWRQWDTAFTEALPLAVLKRELLLHLDQLERFSNAS